MAERQTRYLEVVVLREECPGSSPGGRTQLRANGEFAGEVAITQVGVRVAGHQVTRAGCKLCFCLRVQRPDVPCKNVSPGWHRAEALSAR